EDLIVEKNRFSAFIQGSSNLAETLRHRGIDTILVTGTVTNVCCESTARDAMMLNFKTIMVTDGNAAVTDQDHNASLCAFYLTFGDIMSTDMLIACLGRTVSSKLAAANSMPTAVGSRIASASGRDDRCKTKVGARPGVAPLSHRAARYSCSPF